MKTHFAIIHLACNLGFILSGSRALALQSLPLPRPSHDIDLILPTPSETIFHTLTTTLITDLTSNGYTVTNSPYEVTQFNLSNYPTKHHSRISLWITKSKSDLFCLDLSYTSNPAYFTQNGIPMQHAAQILSKKLEYITTTTESYRASFAYQKHLSDLRYLITTGLLNVPHLQNLP